jgi:hypothetical protein
MGTLSGEGTADLMMARRVESAAANHIGCHAKQSG